MTGRRIMPRPMASRSACWPASSPTPADAEDHELSQLAWRDLGQAQAAAVTDVVLRNR
jgi:hypothetical protein